MMLSAEDSDRGSSTSSSDESEDFEKHCAVCSFKYPTSQTSEQCWKAKQMIAGYSATVVMTGSRKFVFPWL